MDRYIGIDAHLRSCTVAVMSASGRKLGSHLVETNGDALLPCIRQIPGRRHICIEEGALSEWLYALLQPFAERIVVVQPRASQGSKSDAIDAWARADELRRGDIPTAVFKAPHIFTGLRHAIRTYLALREDVKRAKHRIKATFRSHAIAASSQLFEPGGRRAWLERVPEAASRQAGLYGDEIDWLCDLRDRAHEWVLEELDQIPDAKYLLAISGVAEIRAAIILATVVSPHRFRSKRQFWSYCGLAVVSRSSSDWVRDKTGWRRGTVVLTRGLNRNCQPQLKDVFKGAAFIVAKNCRKEHPWRRSYERQLEQGMKPNLAMLTLARRISATTLALWKRKELFDRQKIHCHT